MNEQTQKAVAKAIREADSELDKPPHDRQRPWEGRHQDDADPAKMAAAQAKWDAMLRGVKKVESLSRSAENACRPDASK